MSNHEGKGTMKRTGVVNWTARIGLFSTAILFGLSCGNESGPLPRAATPQVYTEVDTACASDVFFYGRPISYADLRNSGRSNYTLESVNYRDVLSRSVNDVEIAYRVEMNMQRQGRTLIPEHILACRVVNNPSPRAMKISRTTLPVLGDIHLPSTRITVFDTSESGGTEDRDRLYNFPRISDFSVSSGNYFSLTQNPARYRGIRVLSEYLDILRYHSLFPRVELREMGYGRIGIYAQKDFAGERAELLIVLVERNP